MFKDYDQKVSQNDLYALIREGEHGEQDFKYRISDKVLRERLKTM